VLVADLGEDAGIGREAGFPPPLAAQSELLEEDAPDLLGRADRELLPGQLEDLPLQGRDPLAEAGADLGQPLGVELQPLALHRGEHVDEWQLHVAQQRLQLELLEPRSLRLGERGDEARFLGRVEAGRLRGGAVNDLVLAAAQRLAAAGSDSARLESRLLWEHAQKTDADFEALIVRRENREPVAYIVEHKEFWSLDFKVGPGVLVPRPDTETLIEEAMRLVADRDAPLRIADFGTGSGAILVAALKEFPNATGIGFESSPDAFGYAAENAARLIGPRAQNLPGRLEQRVRAVRPYLL